MSAQQSSALGEEVIRWKHWSEERPSDDQDVLIQAYHGRIEMATYVGDGWWRRAAYILMLTDFQVIAWADGPKGPKPQKTTK